MKILFFILYLIELLIQILILWGVNNFKNLNSYDDKKIIVKYDDKLLWNLMLYIKADIVLIFFDIGFIISSKIFDYSVKYIPTCLILTILILLLIIYYYLLFRNKEIKIDKDSIKIKNIIGRKRFINFNQISKVKMKSSRKIKIKAQKGITFSINNKMSNFNRFKEILEKNLIE